MSIRIFVDTNVMVDLLARREPFMPMLPGSSLSWIWENAPQRWLPCHSLPLLICSKSG